MLTFLIFKKKWYNLIENPSTNLSKFYLQDGLEERNKLPTFEWPEKILSMPESKPELQCVMQDNDGNDYVQDLAKSSDIPHIAEWLEQLHTSGQGFTEHETIDVSDMEDIINGAVPHHYLTTVKPLSCNDDDIAVIGLCLTSSTVRSLRPVVHDLWTFVNPKYAGLGIGRKSVSEIMRIFKKAGYQAMVSDLFLSAPIAWRTFSYTGGTAVGFIPYASFMKGYGWTDTVIVCRVY